MKPEKIEIHNVIIKYKTHERNDALIAQNVVNEFLSRINELWEIELPYDTSIIINGKLLKHFFRALPFYRKMIFGILFPLWYWRRKEYLRLSNSLLCINKSGFTLVVKPIYAFASTVLPINDILFYKARKIDVPFQVIICNALGWVALSLYDLKVWLREGFVLFASEFILEMSLIKPGTLLLFAAEQKYSILEASKLNDPVDLQAYNYAKGYWTVRYLEEEFPGFLKEVLKQYKGEDITMAIGERLGLDTSDREKMWYQLDEFLYNHYKYLLETE